MPIQTKNRETPKGDRETEKLSRNTKHKPSGKGKSFSGPDNMKLRRPANSRKV